jgi:hypothetical protein
MANRSWTLLCGGLMLLAAAYADTLRATEKGEYRGKVVAEWLGDGRKMQLREPFEYIDPEKRRWQVPSGTVVDGASIPQVFWSIMGGPFEGLYRNASVIHDYYCDARTRTFEDVHRVFYNAMLTSGVGERTAWLMYKAVQKFGPSWDPPKIDRRCEDPSTFDFEICAQAAKKPAKRIAKVDRKGMDQFLREIEKQVDPADLAKLQDITTKLGD